MAIMPTSSNNRQQYHVRFSEDCNVVGMVPNRIDISKEEMNARWFEESEYAELIWESSVTLAILRCEEKKHLIDDVLLCSRGLLDKETFKIRHEERTFIKNLVLFQLRAKHLDEDSVAKFYQECCLPSLKRAHRNALQDEQDVKDFMRQPNAGQDKKNSLQYTPQENRAAIEAMIIKIMQDTEEGGENVLSLKMALQRLTNRERQLKQKREKRESMIIQQINEIAQIYHHPLVSPVQKANLENIVEQLVQQLPQERVEAIWANIKDTIQLSNYLDSSGRNCECLVAQADTKTLIEEVLLYRINEQQSNSKVDLSEATVLQELLSWQTGQQQSNKRQRII